MDHPWWTQKEKELGNKLRKTRVLTREFLIEVVNWKFKEMLFRRKNILGKLTTNSDEKIRDVSNQFFKLDSKSDSFRVDALRKIYGFGLALACTVLTFLNPRDYGVFDIHVCRELYGEEPSGMGDTSNYLKVLRELRKIATQTGLDVRTVEKALFKKNLDEA